MSLAHYIVLERDIPGFDPFVNGKCMAHASDELDALAKRLHVTPLMEFFSTDPGALAEEFGEPSDGRDYSPEVWYEPEAGLQTVEALLAYLVDNPEAIHEPNPDYRIVDDLREFQAVLQRARTECVKWHMDIDH